MSTQKPVSAAVSQAAADLLASAKSNMIYNHVFFAALVYGLPFHEDVNVDTAETDGEAIYYNPTWVSQKNLAEIIFLLAHEVLHVAFYHCLRVGERDAKKWNIATDLVINELLVDGKVGQFIKGGLLDKSLSAGKTADEVYAALPDEDQNQGGKPKPGSGSPQGAPIDNLRKPKPQDKAGLEKLEAETKIKVAQARNLAKQAGQLSAGLARIVEDLLKTETDWKTVLRRFFSERAKTDWSYAKPKRRFLAEDVYLPGLVGEKLGKVVVAVDCSGSVSEKLLQVFGAELRGIVEDTRPSEVEVIYFDSEVLPPTEVFGPDDEVKLNSRGGGGTKFSPVFRYIENLETQPVAVVFLTDLLCDDFGPAPDYPVLWASVLPNWKTPVFGEVIFINPDKK